MFLTLRTLLVRSVSKNTTLTIEAKRRWVVTIRNSVALGFLLGLVFIWLHELQTFAVSLVAIAAALVLATKELLLCWSGAALRVGGKVYAVGDRIQIGGYRGVVLDHDAFATKLLEIGPGLTAHLYTGRIVVFPNSMLFTNGLVKENPAQDYGLYILSIPLRTEDDWETAERVLLEVARAECAAHLEEASRQMKLLEQRNLLEAPSPEPTGYHSTPRGRTSAPGPAVSCSGSGPVARGTGHHPPISPRVQTSEPEHNLFSDRSPTIGPRRWS